MLPMVSGIGELRAAREIIASVQRRLISEGKEHRTDVPIGIMVEVPSAALTAETLARECDFFSIGTNDLLQFLLAVDRTNERVDYLYHPLHPAVLRILSMVTTAAAGAGIPVSLCGEMAGDPVHTPILLGLGVQQLSMNAGSIPQVKRVVRELRQDECEELVRSALACRSQDETTELVNSFVQSKTSVARDLFAPEV